MIPDAV